MGNARSVFKRLRFPLDIMLLCVRWYVAYALSLRYLEEMMQERGAFVDHSTIHRWVVKLVPVLERALRKRKRKRGIGAVGKSWRLDETSHMLTCEKTTLPQVSRRNSRDRYRAFTRRQSGSHSKSPRYDDNRKSKTRTSLNLMKKRRGCPQRLQDRLIDVVAIETACRTTASPRSCAEPLKPMRMLSVSQPTVLSQPQKPHIPLRTLSRLRSKSTENDLASVEGSKVLRASFSQTVLPKVIEPSSLSTLQKQRLPTQVGA